MTICCLKGSGPPSSNSDCDGDDDTNFEIPKLNEVSSAINVYKCYNSARICTENFLGLLVSLQNNVNALKCKKVKQTKLFNFFKAGTGSRYFIFYFLCNL